VPDVLLFFSIDLIPTGTTLRPTDLSSQTAFLARAASSFAALIGVPAASVYATNITDRATGSSVTLRAVRRAQAPAAAGSLGVTLSFVVRLGKTPTQASVANMSAVLSSSAASAAISSVATGFCSSAGLSTCPIAAKFNAVVLQYAPFSIASDAGSSSSSASSSSGSATGAIVGVAIAVAFAAVGVWSYRSYAKHGKLPCLRDRKMDRAKERLKSVAAIKQDLEREMAERERARAAELKTVNPLSRAAAEEELDEEERAALEAVRAKKARKKAAAVPLADRMGVAFEPTAV
jgi:hypothetical protein